MTNVYQLCTVQIPKFRHFVIWLVSKNQIGQKMEKSHLDSENWWWSLTSMWYKCDWLCSREKYYFPIAYSRNKTHFAQNGYRNIDFEEWVIFMELRARVMNDSEKCVRNTRITYSEGLKCARRLYDGHYANGTMELGRSLYISFWAKTRKPSSKWERRWEWRSYKQVRRKIRIIHNLPLENTIVVCTQIFHRMIRRECIDNCVWMTNIIYVKFTNV